MDTPDLEAVRTYLLQLQSTICAALEEEDGKTGFVEDVWERPEGGGGRSRVLEEGAIFEKAGVNVSTVGGEFSDEFRDRMPGAAEDPRFWASGISVVIHPRYMADPP